MLPVLLAGLAAAPLGAQETHLVIVSGLGGEPAYADSLVRWGGALVSGAGPDASVTWLAEDPSRDERIDGPSRKDDVARALGRIAREGGPDDVVFIVLMGHGSQDGRGARLNLPGPDLGADELAALLKSLEPRRVAVVNTASSSGAMLEALAAPGRAVVTATATGSERNQTWFGRFFAEAFAGGGADTDKDGAVSLLEAFEFARLQVEELYQRSRQIQSEHPLLDDDGDGVGAREPTGAGDGALAAGLFLSRPAMAVAEAPEGASPELRRLYEERAALTERLQALQARRASMEEAAYDREFEAIMIELAVKNRAIRELEGQP